eukprot:scaffold6532_cov116-Isochrysis_galbana.AAC.1
MRRCKPSASARRRMALTLTKTFPWPNLSGRQRKLVQRRGLRPSCVRKLTLTATTTPPPPRRTLKARMG